MQVLAVNAGSSSVKLALFGMRPSERRLVSARFEGIGLGQGRCFVRDGEGRLLLESYFGDADHEAAVRRFAEWLGRSEWASELGAVGHRIVQGGASLIDPVVITSKVEEEVAAVASGRSAPDVRVAAELGKIFPAIPHVACFDTAFHRQMPAVARMHPMPRQLAEQGVQRFGSHGLSCEFLLQQLAQDAGTEAAQGRVLIAHLGDVASMTAVNAGRSVDTTAGFTPNGGLMSGTHPGDVCPGVVMHLLVGAKLSAESLNDLLNSQSGLLGVSGLSRDMRELLKVSGTNPWAMEAVQLFCYSARKHLGSLAAVLGGVDTLIFSGGIGENSPEIRRAICEQMQFLGIRLDPVRNRGNEPVISAEGGPVSVRVMATNEELVIARHTCAAIGRPS